VRDLRFTKREFASFAAILRPKGRDRYADESDALGRREDRPDQAEGGLVHLARRHRSNAMKSCHRNLLADRLGEKA
jgi:hypothetical protein